MAENARKITKLEPNAMERIRKKKKRRVTLKNREYPYILS